MNRQRIRKSIIFISFLLFPITIYYFSPALTVEEAYNRIVTGRLIVFTLLFLLSLVFGRDFAVGAFEEIESGLKKELINKGEFSLYCVVLIF